MTRRLLALVLAATALLAAPALAHQGNPNYLSVIDQVTPSLAGLELEVVNRDDALQLVNRTGQDVVLEGYNGDPYARVLADGTVEVNTQSPAYYLNEERFGTESPPDGVDGKGEPEWKLLSKTGRFQWHDHRAHYMGKGIPKQVTDQDVKTKVFDWKVPLTVGGQAGTVAGTLFWTPSAGGGPPLGAMIGLGLLLLASIVVVVVVRRRRAAGSDEPGAGSGGPAREAW